MITRIFQKHQLMCRPLCGMREFSAATKKKGPNNEIQDAREQGKKYGIKVRFYNLLPTIAKELPKDL